MMGGLVGRYDRAGDQEDYDLAEPDDVLKRYVAFHVEGLTRSNSVHATLMLLHGRYYRDGTMAPRVTFNL